MSVYGDCVCELINQSGTGPRRTCYSCQILHGVDAQGSPNTPGLQHEMHNEMNPQPPVSSFRPPPFTMHNPGASGRRSSAPIGIPQRQAASPPGPDDVFQLFALEPAGAVPRSVLQSVAPLFGSVSNRHGLGFIRQTTSAPGQHGRNEVPTVGIPRVGSASRSSCNPSGPSHVGNTYVSHISETRPTQSRVYRVGSQIPVAAPTRQRMGPVGARTEGDSGNPIGNLNLNLNLNGLRPSSIRQTSANGEIHLHFNF